MIDILEIVKSFEDSGLLAKVVTSTTENEAKKSRFVGMLLSTLGASLQRNILTSKGVIRAEKGIFDQLKVFVAISSFN